VRIILLQRLARTGDVGEHGDEGLVGDRYSPLVSFEVVCDFDSVLPVDGEDG